MHYLVEKFEKVKITQESLLPAEDIQFCELHQTRLKETLQQLQEWQDYMNEKQKTENNPAYELEVRSYSRGDMYVSKTGYSYRDDDDSDKNPYDVFKFTVLYDLVTIEKLIKKAKYFFINRVFKYFNEKYSVNLTVRDSDEDKRDFTDYRVIIEDIRIQLGGHLDFNIVALDNAIKAFKSQIWFASRVELKGKTITLVDYMRYDHCYSTNGSKFHYDGKYLTCLDHAISIFEREEVINGFALGNNIAGESVDFTSDYPVLNGSRVEAIRFYKNRKVIIKFVDIQAAKDFHNRLSLSVFDKD